MYHVITCRAALDREKAFIADQNAKAKTMVALNVRGMPMDVPRDVLVRCQESMLEAMFSGVGWRREAMIRTEKRSQ
jgi:hypothetical protein